MFKLLTRCQVQHCLWRAAGQSKQIYRLSLSFRTFTSCTDSVLPNAKMGPPEIVPVTVDGRLYRTVKEGQANILAPYSRDTAKSKKTNTQVGQPKNNDEGNQAVFYNPIQQYNRDLSVLAILVYGESAIQLKRAKHDKNVSLSRQKRKNKPTTVSSGTSRDADSILEISKKRKSDEAGLDPTPGEETDTSKRKRGDPIDDRDNRIPQEPTATTDDTLSAAAPSTHLNGGATEQNEQITAQERSKKEYQTSFTVLDALSASGLRAIRYAKEIPFATTIVANDYSPEAVKAIDLNVEHNGLTGKVFSNQGDARQYMYSKTGNESSQKGPSYVHKFDVVDLDPYGTAAPFLDAAIQAVADGGMLCVTCTDGGVWASNGYPEKAYALYAGIPLKGSHSHEAGLRIILHSIATSAAKYGIAIEPLLSLSIDFYARLFVRVHKSQQEVKLLAGTTMLVYNCDQGCSAWQTQLVARNQERMAKNDDVYYKHGFAQAPLAEKYCEHCGTKSHLGGPMWAGPLHNPAFIQKILNVLPHVDKTVYGTTDRIKGMLTVALEEEDLEVPQLKHEVLVGEDLPPDTPLDSRKQTEPNPIIPRLPAHLISNQPFFFMPTYLAKVLSLPTPSDDPLRGAFLGLGYTCTRSHCKAGSFKTNAPWNVIWEIFREWARQKESDRIPRLLGEGEFEGRASVKKTSPGAKILKRLRGRPQDTLSIARLRENLLERLGDGTKSTSVESSVDLRDLLTSALYDLEHLPVRNPQQAVGTNGEGPSSLPKNASNQVVKISGKQLIENGGDSSELDIVFDAERGRAFRESKSGKLVRYQINPRPNWGPMVRAGAGN